ncbi:ABC transporter permease [Flavobacterium caeni]|uniref:ABC-2 type transport system permease protein n=1 Tax=Flavobacterium caeni TaxID=490189 RepID=A0A1G5H5F6_9FLAO|nr:ABC transporter permease [Flavobacterium caeni]SCY59033.1 ABC-2 type transport system permease protein [Flavobacterium caeni]
MLYKIYQSVLKEILLLSRDLGGAIILFVMPLVLVITVTLIQDSTFKQTGNAKIPILLVDHDHGKVSQSVNDNLAKSNAFDVISRFDNQPITEAQAKEAVFKGKYQLAIVIPADLSHDLQAKIDQNVNKIMTSFGVGDSSATATDKKKVTQKEVKLYFDPAVQIGFKNGVMSAIDQMISQIETQSIYAAFKEQLGETEFDFEQQSFINFKEIVPTIGNKEVKPNSVQHNVPAWTLFAMFFIVIPLSINIVKEKSQGTFVRLQTNPVRTWVVMAGKTITYLIICMLQFYMILAVAFFVFPHLGLPPLHFNFSLMLMSLVALFCGFAAIGYGILVGTIAKTQEQSAPFGSTSVIILAAIGGVWVPVFAMPEMMQIVARCSPMNWGLNAFYDVILRQARLVDVLPEIGLLFLFFLLTTTIALLYDKKKRTV